MDVYFVQNSWEGIKVFEVQNRLDADVVVGIAKNSWGGTAVYRVTNSWDADLKIYIDNSPLAGIYTGVSYGGGYYTPPKMTLNEEASSTALLLFWLLLKGVGIYLCINAFLMTLLTLLYTIDASQRHWLPLFIPGTIVLWVAGWWCYSTSDKHI